MLGREYGHMLCQASREFWRESKIFGDNGSTPCSVLNSPREGREEQQNHCLRPPVVSQRLGKRTGRLDQLKHQFTDRLKRLGLLKGMDGLWFVFSSFGELPK